MSFYVLLSVLLMVCLYCGQVFGLMIYCDNCSDFKDAKRYVFLIPFLKIALFIAYAKDCVEEKRWKDLLRYISIGDKSVLIICSIVELLPELCKEQKKAKVREIRRKPKVSILSLAKIVLFETQQDCATYNFRYM